MAIKRNLGGDRIGSGNKRDIYTKSYERSTHDLGFIWRTTMAPGTLVPFMSEVALTGDTWDINLLAEMLTLPTIGPLFGSFKLQFDVYQCPIRLYNSWLHNNRIGIANEMQNVKFPRLAMPVYGKDYNTEENIDNTQVNPSSLLSYLGIRGFGIVSPDDDDPIPTRYFNAIPILAYYEICKNYYCNKQENQAHIIHTPSTVLVKTITSVNAAGSLLDEWPDNNTYNVLSLGSPLELNYTGTPPLPEQIMILTVEQGWIRATELFTAFGDSGTYVFGYMLNSQYVNWTVHSWRYVDANDLGTGRPEIDTFPLSNIDDMRDEILANPGNSAYSIAHALGIEPYKWLNEAVWINNPDATNPIYVYNCQSSQEGLMLKTYQSDLYNNWLNAETITDINTASAVSTVGNLFTMEQLALAKKVYEYLNDIAASGGTFHDWNEVTYDTETYGPVESPIYLGSLIKELVFQEVVSNTETEGQPLGTLAGRGKLTQKHKGGRISVRINEPSYIIGIASITPRITYSQGNKWDVHLMTMDDLHKPALDQIGFQDSINEQRAWWSTHWDGSEWVNTSAGKIPAWSEYMTNVDRVHGNFAIENNQMFMVLNRRFEPDENADIVDLTTYIDPSKFNHIFAETQLDAQNFWCHLGVDITARRKMSAKVMPKV